MECFARLMLASRFFALGAMTVTCALASSGCMVHRVPPPPAPNAELPPSVAQAVEAEDEAASPRPNTSRVTITTDVPATVVHLSAVHSLTRSRGRIPYNDIVCERTPCTITLPYGHQELKLTALDDDGRVSKTIVVVAEPRVAVNHTLGQYRTSKGRIGGMLIALAGAALVGIGLGLDDAARARAIGIGAGAILGGGLVWGLSHETKQEGTTTQWTPQPSSREPTSLKPKDRAGEEHFGLRGAGIGTSLGFRF